MPEQLYKFTTINMQACRIASTIPDKSVSKSVSKFAESYNIQNLTSAKTGWVQWRLYLQSYTEIFLALISENLEASGARDSNNKTGGIPQNLYVYKKYICASGLLLLTRVT